MTVKPTKADVTYSHNGVLNSKMTKTDVTSSGNQKAILEFQKANTNNDDYLTAEEIFVYDSKENKNKVWGYVAKGAAILSGIGAVLYAVRTKKLLNNVKLQLGNVENNLLITQKSFDKFRHSTALDLLKRNGIENIPPQYTPERVAAAISRAEASGGVQKYVADIHRKDLHGVGSINYQGLEDMAILEDVLGYKTYKESAKLFLGTKGHPDVGPAWFD